MDLQYETTLDEFSSIDDVLSKSEMTESSEESSLEVMGLILRDSTSLGEGENTTIPDIREAKLEGMLAKRLLLEEKRSYVEMLRKHKGIFIIDYSKITGVLVIKHHIELKKEAK